jgi:hypothetical protein
MSQLPHDLGDRLLFLTPKDIENLKQRCDDLRPERLAADDLESLELFVEREMAKQFSDVFHYSPAVDASGTGFALGELAYMNRHCVLQDCKLSNSSTCSSSSGIAGSASMVRTM